jgi:hypothetical protein
MKVTLIRNWMDIYTDPKNRVLRLKGETVDIPDNIAKGYAEAEAKAGPEFIPYFAATEETKAWLKYVDKRHADVKAANAKRDAKFAASKLKD